MSFGHSRVSGNIAKAIIQFVSIDKVNPNMNDHLTMMFGGASDKFVMFQFLIIYNKTSYGQHAIIK
jgi:hypothetical protein